MIPQSLKASWKTLLFLVFGFLIFFLYLLIFNVDIQKIIAIAQTIDLKTYFLAVIAVLLEIFFFSISWRQLLRFLSVKLSLVRAFLYMCFAIFLDILIPAESISGDISKIYLVTREHKGTSGKVVASLVTQRLTGLGINVGSLILGLGLILIDRQISGMVLHLTLILVILSTSFLLLLLLLCFKERWMIGIVEFIVKLLNLVGRGRWNLKKIKADMIRAAKIFHSSMKQYMQAPTALLTSITLHVFSWFFSLTVAYLVFMSIGYSVPFGVVIVICAIVAAVRAIPLGVPFEAGLPEITMSTLYILLGVPPDVSATVTLLYSFLTVWLRFFLGFAIQQWLGIKAITDMKRENLLINL
ncbi:MAG: lysylphosphatidylglycerol synthase transmembrane domain-containing protein [Candidatus Bathyarchaeota archaeon]